MRETGTGAKACNKEKKTVILERKSGYDYE